MFSIHSCPARSMTIEIIKGLKYFYILLFVLYISFGIALLNLFKVPGVRQPLRELSLRWALLRFL